MSKTTFTINTEDLPFLLEALKRANLPVKNRLYYLTKEIENEISKK